MSVVFEKTSYLTEKPFHYCPGCGHGIIHRLVAECLEESGMGEKIAGVAPVGCSVFAYDYFNCDMLEAAHGRAPAVATGVKRAKPDTLVFTYQGDGDFVVNTSDPDKDVYRLDIGTALGEIEKRDSITLKVKKEG